MKLITAVAALVLLAAEASAATFTFNFTKTDSLTIGPCDYIPPVTRGGITARFRSAFYYDQSVLGGGFYFCDNQYGRYTTGGEYGMEPGDYVNDPLCGNWAAAMAPNECGIYGEPYKTSIFFDPPGIRYFACDLLGTTIAHLWSCEPWVCSQDGGQTWSTHCTFPLGSIMDDPVYGRSVIEMYDAQNVLRASVLPELIEGAPGPYPPFLPLSGDFDWSMSLAPHRVWQRVEVTSPVLINRVSFTSFNAHWALARLWIDNIVASTWPPDCQHPPNCDFRASVARVESGPPETINQTPPMGAAPFMVRDSRAAPTARTSWGRVKSIYR